MTKTKHFPLVKLSPSWKVPVNICEDEDGVMAAAIFIAEVKGSVYIPSKRTPAPWNDYPDISCVFSFHYIREEVKCSHTGDKSLQYLRMYDSVTNLFLIIMKIWELVICYERFMHVFVGLFSIEWRKRI